LVELLSVGIRRGETVIFVDYPLVFVDGVVPSAACSFKV